LTPRPREQKMELPGSRPAPPPRKAGTEAKRRPDVNEARLPSKGGLACSIHEFEIAADFELNERRLIPNR